MDEGLGCGHDKGWGADMARGMARGMAPAERSRPLHASGSRLPPCAMQLLQCHRRPKDKAGALEWLKRMQAPPDLVTYNILLK